MHQSTNAVSLLDSTGIWTSVRLSLWISCRYVSRHEKWWRNGHDRSNSGMHGSSWLPFGLHLFKFVSIMFSCLMNLLIFAICTEKKLFTWNSTNIFPFIWLKNKGEFHSMFIYFFQDHQNCVDDQTTNRVRRQTERDKNVDKTLDLLADVSNISFRVVMPSDMQTTRTFSHATVNSNKGEIAFIVTVAVVSFLILIVLIIVKRRVHRQFFVWDKYWMNFPCVILRIEQAI